MNKRIASAFFSLILVASATATHAAEPPVDKKFTLDISSPGTFSGQPSVGGRMFIDANTALEASGNIQLTGKDTNAGVLGGTQIVATGGIMKYISKGRVSPFIRAGGTVGIYFGDRYANTDNDLQGYAGVGAEFMITQELSLRASANGMLAISPFKLVTGTSDLTLSFFF